MTMIFDGTAGITFPDSSQQFNSYYGFKNKIINGAMVIDQRNAGASYTQVNGLYNLDRWAGNSFDGNAAVNKYSVIQSSTAPTGFSKSLLVTSLAATASGASNIFNLEQKIEGFIAHELAEVCPSAVSGEKDAVETYLDDESNEQTRIKPQGIDTSFLVATLTAAIQELKAINDTQAATITALTARIVALETI